MASCWHVLAGVETCTRKRTPVYLGERMSFSRTLPLATLLRDHPWASEVLSWHGLSSEAIDQRLSIATLCVLHELDESRLMRDLEARRMAHEGPDELGWGSRMAL